MYRTFGPQKSENRISTFFRLKVEEGKKDARLQKIFSKTQHPPPSIDTKTIKNIFAHLAEHKKISKNLSCLNKNGRHLILQTFTGINIDGLLVAISTFAMTTPNFEPVSENRYTKKSRTIYAWTSGLVLYTDNFIHRFSFKNYLTQT